ncbi:MAG: DNA-binding protein WhiA, partial [Ruthenibacterium sp.]
MSFAQEVKKEMMAHELPKKCCAIAAAYSIACFGKYFDARGIVLHTEQAAVAQYAQRVLERAGIHGEAYPRGKEKNGLYEFSVKDEDEVRGLLALFGHTGHETTLRINSKNFVCEHCVNSFVSMAFLCCGTMTNPEKEYNLEFLSGRYNLMHDFEALLMGHGFTPRHTQRKGANVLYLKSSEQIEDMLTFMGATSAALQIMNTKVYKDIRNKANRITNCETANIDKTVAANQNTLQAIAYLRRHGALTVLPEALREAAKLREAMPDISLKDLAEQFEPP